MPRASVGPAGARPKVAARRSPTVSKRSSVPQKKKLVGRWPPVSFSVAAYLFWLIPFSSAARRAADSRQRNAGSRRPVETKQQSGPRRFFFARSPTKSSILAFIAAARCSMHSENPFRVWLREPGLGAGCSQSALWLQRRVVPPTASGRMS